jgi:hypothetical protein
MSPGYIFLGLLIFVVFANVECIFLHLRFNGNMKRGILIWRESLTAEQKRALRSLLQDYIEPKTGEFIKRQQNSVLIQPVRIKQWHGGAFPYVGYVDLGVRNAKIEYRIPISSSILLFAFVSTVSYFVFSQLKGFPALVFLFVLFYWNHVSQRKSIHKLIARAVNSN